MISRYLILAILNIILMLVSAIFSPVIALFAKSDGTYPAWLYWAFGTRDCPVWGDDRYLEQDMAWVKQFEQEQWLQRYILTVAWNCRNPAYSFSQYTAAVVILNPINYSQKGDSYVDIGYNVSDRKARLNLGTQLRRVESDGRSYFEYVKAARWGNTNWGYMVNFGWNLEAIENRNKLRCLNVGIRPLINLVHN